MQRLADWLSEEVRRAGGVRRAAEKAGVAPSTIHRIMHNQLAEKPKLVTLVRLSTTFNRPLEDLVEWAGFPPSSAEQDDADLSRLQLQAQADPLLREILAMLHQTSPADRRAILTYLRGARQDSDQ